MKSTTPYKIHSSYISAKKGNIHSGDIDTYTYNVGYYDDTKLLSYVNSLGEQVNSISHNQDSIINNFNSYVSKTELNSKKYITMAQVSAQGYISSIPSYYVTDEELSSMGYLTQHQDLSEYAKKSEIPSLSGYATKNWVEEQHYLTYHQDLSNYATQDQIPDMEYYATKNWVSDKNYLTYIPNYYVTDSKLTTAINNVPLSTREMDELFPIE